MSHSPSWISAAVKKFSHVQEPVVDLTSDDSRQMVEHSSLLDKMRAACVAVNSQMDEEMVYEETFFQPHPCFCRYEYRSQGMVFNMDLESSAEGPMLTFWLMKPKMGTGILERYFKYRPDNNYELKQKLLIDPVTVRNADVHHWFTYLVSGFHFMFKPAQSNPSPWH